MTVDAVDAVDASMRVAAARYVQGNIAPFNADAPGFGAGRWPHRDRPDAVLLSRVLDLDIEVDVGDSCGGGRAASIRREGDLVVAIRSMETERPIHVKVYVNNVNMANVAQSTGQRLRSNPWPAHSFVLPPGGAAQPLSGGRALPLIAMSYQEVVVVVAVGHWSDASVAHPTEAGSKPGSIELVYALVEGDVRRTIALADWDSRLTCGPTAFAALVEEERAAAANAAARRIQRAFRCAIANPAFEMCRRRLEREFESG